MKLRLGNRGEGERENAGPNLEQALGRRPPGNWRIWDLFNNYTSKQHINKTKKLNEELLGLERKLRKAKSDKQAKSLAKQFQARRSEFITRHEAMARFHGSMRTTIDSLKSELAEKGDVSDKLKWKRELLQDLGRGNLEKKMEVLRQHVKDYEEMVTDLKGAGAADETTRLGERNEEGMASERGSGEERGDREEGKPGKEADNQKPGDAGQKIKPEGGQATQEGHGQGGTTTNTVTQTAGDYGINVNVPGSGNTIAINGRQPDGTQTDRTRPQRRKGEANAGEENEAAERREEEREMQEEPQDERMRELAEERMREEQREEGEGGEVEKPVRTRWWQFWRPRK